MAAVPKRVLSDSQLEQLAEKGEERTAEVGETLFKVGDTSYPLIAILEGEVAVLDAFEQELTRHGPHGFLGELNLMSGQTVFLTARVTQPMRYIAVERDAMRELLFEDAAIADLLLGAFVERRESLQQVHGIGFLVIGQRESTETRRLLDFARAQRLPHTWVDPHEAGVAESQELPLVRLPEGQELVNPSNGELYRALGIGADLADTEAVDLLVVGGGPAGLGAAVYGASEGLSTLVVESTVLGGQAGSSRRIENYLGFPAGISGTELAGRAITQARKFGARVASPFKALSLNPDSDSHLVTLDNGTEVQAKAVLLATGASYRRLPVPGLERYEGESVFYAAGPLEGNLCSDKKVAVVGGGNSAGQAAVWLARGKAGAGEDKRVMLLHRRSDLRETMSQYLIDELVRFNVEIRDNSEIRELEGIDGRLEAVELTDGERIPLSYLFLFLGAEPCTEWLDDVVARDKHGFVLTGPAAGSESALETSVPGVYAAGDVRAGSVKRCTTAVAEGATVVSHVHERLAAVDAAPR